MLFYERALSRPHCQVTLEKLMTSSGKIRIYELSRDLNLDNKDVLDAAKKLSILVKSHSSSISNEEVKQIKELLNKKNTNISSGKSKQPSKEILSLKKAPSSEVRRKPDSKKPINTNDKKIKKESIKGSPNLPLSHKKPEIYKKEAISEKTANSSIKQLEIQKQESNKPSINSIPPKPPQKLSSPIRPNNVAISNDSNGGENQKNNRERLNQKPNIIGKPLSPSQSIQKSSTKRHPTTSEKKDNNKGPENRPQPIKPISPPTRPKVHIQENKPIRGSIPQRAPNQKKPYYPTPAGKYRNQNNQNRSNSQKRPGQPPYKGNPPELIGSPISRKNKPDNRRDQRPGGRPGGYPPRPGGPRPGGASPSSPGRVQGPPGRPNRPGMPSGMRKPVSPGELMQLQKPSSRPSNGPPKRPEAGPPKAAKPGSPKPPTRNPQAASPKKPAYRAGAGSPRRQGRPDWDDAAKLDAIRNKSPQKQRQKVHIIGENDDALTTETSGFAGEQQALVLSASLARPSKPKFAKTTTGKPSGALRKRKKESTRQRQRRRAMELRAAREAKQVRPEMIVVPEDNITVQELADKLSVESSEIIKSLFFKGITATVTQSLDLQTIETVAEEFGVPVLQDDIEEAAKKTVEMIEETDIDHLIKRPPVVTVMGHVDHGKTSLLDAIRKARVASGEAGGITQHIGAYQVEVQHDKKTRKITFLDTPGHEAFTAMRARGTKVTDVAILVVAADDGVRPQTLEAISHARAAKVPIIVAINKIDKEGASSDRVMKELSEQELVAEEWGGEVVMVPVSAIKGQNIDKLLEMILLVTEVEDLQANPTRLAKGTVIEAHLDKAKGPVATLLVQNGTLNSGDVLAAGPVLGKVRAMVDENGLRLKEAGPSSPVEALGFNEVPTAGDEFEVYPDEKSARNVVGDRASDARATRLAQQMASRRVSLSSISGQANEGDLKELNIILKADVQGSVEAILGSLEQLPKDEVQVRVLLSAPGEITETDVDLAAASGAVIVGFNTSMASGAKKAADANSVDVRDYEVIYKLLEDIQLAMEGLLAPDLVEEKLGSAEVRAIFTIGKSAVAGCYVTNGKLQRNCKVRVQRGSEIVFEGDLDSLRRNKEVVKDVSNGFECGVGCDRFANWKEGDIIAAYKLVTQKRKLNG